MFPDIAIVCCVILALGACFPIDEHLEKRNYLNETWENEEEDGFRVILKSPSQIMKVEVVDENGNARVQEMELASEEERLESEEKIEISPRSYQCNWQRLYRLFLSKRKLSSGKNWGNKRKVIRDAFKVVCENPEAAITYLLDLV